MYPGRARFLIRVLVAVRSIIFDIALPRSKPQTQTVHPREEIFASRAEILGSRSKEEPGYRTSDVRWQQATMAIGLLSTPFPPFLFFSVSEVSSDLPFQSSCGPCCVLSKVPAILGQRTRRKLPAELLRFVIAIESQISMKNLSFAAEIRNTTCHTICLEPKADRTLSPSCRHCEGGGILSRIYHSGQQQRTCVCVKPEETGAVF